jgi:hypothetical protein
MMLAKVSTIYHMHVESAPSNLTLSLNTAPPLVLALPNLDNTEAPLHVVSSEQAPERDLFVFIPGLVGAPK